MESIRQDSPMDLSRSEVDPKKIKWGNISDRRSTSPLHYLSLSVAHRSRMIPDFPSGGILPILMGSPRAYQFVSCDRYHKLESVNARIFLGLRVSTLTSDPPSHRDRPMHDPLVKWPDHLSPKQCKHASEGRSKEPTTKNAALAPP